MSQAMYFRQVVEKKFLIGMIWAVISMLLLVVPYVQFSESRLISIAFSVMAILVSMYLLHIATLPADRKHYKNFYKILYACNIIFSTLFLLGFIFASSHNEIGLMAFSFTLPIMLFIEHKYMRYKMNLHNIL